MDIYVALAIALACFAIFFAICRFRLVLSVLLILLILVLLRSGVFVVSEGSQAVATMFDQIVGKPYTKAGVYFKIPLLWKIHYFDKRIFTIPEYEAGIATKDRYFITVDSVFNWRISNPALFIQSMTNVPTAEEYLRNIVSGHIRQVISANNLLETIRSTGINYSSDNNDYLRLNDMRRSPLLGLNYKLSIGRNHLNSYITNSCNVYTKQFGMEIVGVLIRNITYEKSVEQRIFSRMVMERLRDATKLRSTGRAEAQAIRGEMQLKYQSIIGPATEEVLRTRGAAEAYATKVQAEAYGKDRDFYNYWRMLNVYKDSLPLMSQGIIFSSNSPFLKWIGSDPNVNSSNHPLLPLALSGNTKAASKK